MLIKWASRSISRVFPLIVFVCKSFVELALKLALFLALHRPRAAGWSRNLELLGRGTFSIMNCLDDPAGVFIDDGGDPRNIEGIDEM